MVAFTGVYYKEKYVAFFSILQQHVW